MATYEQSAAWIESLPSDQQTIVKRAASLHTLKQNYEQTMESGGRVAERLAKIKFARAGGQKAYDKALAALQADPQLYQQYQNMGISTSGLGQGAPILAALALVAGGVSLLGASTASTASATVASSASATVAPTVTAELSIADTYAAMTSAAGLTTSGNIVADIALAGAVQSAALPVAAAQVYAASVAAGELAAEAVTSGIAETLTVADIVQGIPTDAAKAVAPAAKAIIPAETVTEKIVDAAINVGGAVGTAALVGTLSPVKPKAAQVPVVPGETINIKLILAALATVGGLVFLT